MRIIGRKKVSSKREGACVIYKFPSWRACIFTIFVGSSRRSHHDWQPQTSDHIFNWKYYMHKSTIALLSKVKSKVKLFASKKTTQSLINFNLCRVCQNRRQNIFSRKICVEKSKYAKNARNRCQMSPQGQLLFKVRYTQRFV